MRIYVARDGAWEGVLLAALTTAGFLYLNLMPAMIHALMDGLHMSREGAGGIASANAYGTAVGNVVGIFLVTRYPWRAAATLLLMALVAFDATSMAVQQASVLALLRFSHGVCGGALVALGLALIGRTKCPERNFGLLMAVQCGLAGAGVIVLPQFVAHHGAVFFFTALLAFDLLVLAALPTIDPRWRDRPQAIADVQTKVSGKALLVTTLAGIFVFQTAKMMVGAHIIEFGRSKGLSLAQVTSTVGVADWFAFLGACSVVFLSARVGRAPPLIIGILTSVVCAFIYRYGVEADAFRIACVVNAVVSAIAISYLFATTARITGSGRHAVLAGVVSKLGLGTGPFAGAVIVSNFGYPTLLATVVILLLICAACATPAAVALDARERLSQSSA